MNENYSFTCITQNFLLWNLDKPFSTVTHNHTHPQWTHAHMHSHLLSHILTCMGPHSFTQPYAHIHVHTHTCGHNTYISARAYALNVQMKIYTSIHEFTHAHACTLHIHTCLRMDTCPHVHCRLSSKHTLLPVTLRRRHLPQHYCRSHRFSCSDIFMYTHSCMLLRAHTCMQAYTHMHTWHTQSFMHACLHAWTLAHMHAIALSCSHVHKYICMH